MCRQQGRPEATFFSPFLPHHLITEFTFLFQPLEVSVPTYSKSFSIHRLCPCPKICPGGGSEQAAALCQGQTGAGCCFPRRTTVEWHSSSWGNQKKTQCAWDVLQEYEKHSVYSLTRSQQSYGPDPPCEESLQSSLDEIHLVCWQDEQGWLRYPSAMPCCGSNFCLEALLPNIF